MQKALAQQEKAVIRLRQREALTGPPDDLDLEMDALLDAARSAGYGSDTEGGGGNQQALTVQRPEFPPASLQLQVRLHDIIRYLTSGM